MTAKPDWDGEMPVLDLGIIYLTPVEFWAIISVMATTYYILCRCGQQADALMSNGQVMIFTTKRAASQQAAKMRVLMEGGPKTTYTVKVAR